MIIELLLIYAAILWVVFKAFKIPVNKWTATTAFLIGVLGIGFILTVMNYFHPYTKEARLYYYTTPIYARVDGRVLEVPVETNVPLKKGDVLFRFDPRPFEYRVESLNGQLEKAEVRRDKSKEELDRSLETLRRGAGAEREVQSWRIKYETAKAEIEDIQAEYTGG